MTAKSKITGSKTRTSAKKSGFQIRWWMILIGVLLVATTGILILRFSKASGVYGVGSGVCNEAGTQGQSSRKDHGPSIVAFLNLLNPTATISGINCDVNYWQYSNAGQRLVIQNTGGEGTMIWQSRTEQLPVNVTGTQGQTIGICFTIKAGSPSAAHLVMKSNEGTHAQKRVDVAGGWGVYCLDQKNISHSSLNNLQGQVFNGGSAQMEVGKAFMYRSAAGQNPVNNLGASL